MTPYEKYWTDMREYFIAKAKSYRKNNDDVFARLYEKRTHDASYMIDHENEYSEDKILR